MAFLEQRISIGIERGTSGGPTAKREKIYDAAGRLRAQRFLREMPVHRYTFDFGKKLLADAEEIRNFFYVVLFTPYEGFRARDWNDYELTHANSRLTLISGSIYQANRVYPVGPVEFLRPIYKLDQDDTPVVFRTRSSVVTTATATVDEDTGQVTVTGHVGGDTYTISAYFDVPVTFADDDALANVGLGGTPAQVLQQLGDVELEELSLEDEA
jgi:uncharacterized protein (TIGR02217 family)